VSAPAVLNDSFGAGPPSLKGQEATDHACGGIGGPRRLGVQNPRPKAAIAGSPRAPFRTRTVRGYRPAPERGSW